MIEPRVFEDPRGYFFESFNQIAFEKAGLPTRFVQDNQSQSQPGTLRGLHFQTGIHAQGKLVRVVLGEIYDVAVDIRQNSPTYGKFFGVHLDAVTHRMVYVPPGFAHGFYVLQPNTIVNYKCTTPYFPAAESGVRWDDPELAIPWPLLPIPISVSEKDKVLPVLKDLHG